MDALLLSIRCVLAVVFVVAAVGKLMDLGGSGRALQDFGVPAAAARAGAVALPVTELVVAGALLAEPSVRWGGVGALVLLCAFVIVVARAISRGETPDCHCFGQIHSEPAGRQTLIRNASLAAGAALIVVAGPGPNLVGGLGSLHGAAIALVAVSLLASILAVAVWQLSIDRRRLTSELGAARAAQAAPGLARGTAAPDFDLAPVRGGMGSLTGLIDRSGPTVLVFVSTTCGPCVTMLPALGHWQDALASSMTVAAIFEGARGDVERLTAEHQLALALAQETRETFDLYQLRATPCAVLIGEDGAVAVAPAEGVTAIEALIRTAAAQSATAALLAQSG